MPDPRVEAASVGLLLRGPLVLPTCTSISAPRVLSPERIRSRRTEVPVPRVGNCDHDPRTSCRWRRHLNEMRPSYPFHGRLPVVIFSLWFEVKARESRSNDFGGSSIIIHFPRDAWNGDGSRGRSRTLYRGVLTCGRLREPVADHMLLPRQCLRLASVQCGIRASLSKVAIGRITQQIANAQMYCTCSSRTQCTGEEMPPQAPKNGAIGPGRAIVSTPCFTSLSVGTKGNTNQKHDDSS